MRIAFVCSNFFSIRRDTKKGTDIIAHTLLTSLAKRQKEKGLQITAFASGDSDLPVKIESIAQEPTGADASVAHAGKQMIFELALLSKAFSQKSSFDLYHINIGDGDIALPFSPFVEKPILITQYHPTPVSYAETYFSLYQKNRNVFFASPTAWQRKRLPSLTYAATVPHGVDAGHFAFHPQGGTTMMWAGRAVPDKGADTAIEVAKRIRQNIRLFGTPKTEHAQWFETEVADRLKRTKRADIVLNKDRLDLVPDYQNSKLFLFPIRWEEPFGLVFIEALSCGTPVVTYARGSTPEIIEDDMTGFLVNPSDDDIRGNWVVKKTGIDGLCEAAEKVYAMPDDEYRVMRRNCRKRVEQYFTAERTADEYIQLYEKIISTYETKK